MHAPGKPNPSPGPSSSSPYPVLSVIIGILLILLALFFTITYVRQLQELIAYSFSAFGGGFMFKYVISTHTTPIAALLTWVGGIGMITRWKIGYFAALSVAVYGIGVQLVSFIMLGTNAFALGHMMGMQAFFLLLLVFQFLVLIATAVLLLLPAGQQYFRVSQTYLIGGIILGAFLVFDYIICLKVLTPWAFS